MGKVRTVLKKIPQPSFFNVFSPPVALGEDATEEEESLFHQQLGEAFQVCVYIKIRIVHTNNKYTFYKN